MSIKTIDESTSIFIFHPASYSAAIFKNSFGEYESVGSIIGKDVLIKYNKVDYYEPQAQKYYLFDIKDKDNASLEIEWDDENRDLTNQKLFIPAQFVTTKLHVIDGNKVKRKLSRKRSRKRSLQRSRKWSPKRSGKWSPRRLGKKIYPYHFIPQDLAEKLANLKL